MGAGFPRTFVAGLTPISETERTKPTKEHSSCAVETVIIFPESLLQQTTRPRPPEPTPVKGEEINITGGSYKGKKAWKNQAKNPTAKMLYVIIDMGEGVELATRIKKKSVGPSIQPPSSYEEAAVQQIPDVHYHLKQAAYHLAKCQITDWEEAARLFTMMCHEAQMELEAEGTKATFYNVDF